MRDFLTGLAVILIVVLTTALVAPYFIDWNGQRAFVEARLSHALGQKVTVGGAIDLKLLPTPYIVLDQTVIGSDDGPIRMGIHHLDLQLSVAPLMHGEFEVVDARLEEPTIRIRLEPDRTLPAIPDAPALRADVRFDRVTVVGGTLAIADPQSGHTFVLDNLDLDADAPSLAGPFKAKGAAGDQASRTTFRLSTTAAQRGRARTHLIVGETATHAGLDLDGTLALTSAGRETVRQSFEGTLALFGHVDDVAHAPVAWKLSGPLKADPAKATLAGGELRLGTEAAGLILAATGDADLGTTPSLHLDLTAKQLDIDRLAGAPVDQVAPPPPELPDLASLRRALAAATPPVPAVLDVSVDTATWGGETLSDLAAHVGLGGSGPQRLQIGGNGPGHTHVGADGLLSPAPAPSFNGAVELSTVDLPHALRWLSLIDPGVALKPEDVPFKPVKLTAKVKADGTGIEATGLALNLGRSTLSGTAHLSLDAPRAKLTAVLQAEALDLDTLPDLAAAHGKTGAFDLDLKLAADAFRLSHAGEGALDAGHLDLALSTNGRHVDLTTFRAQNLGGASVAATGHLDADGATLNATIDAAKLDAFAALVRQVAPSPWTDALVARAPTLSPAKLSIDATLTPTGTETTGALHPSRMQVDGTLGATSLNMRVDPPIEGKQIVSLTGSLRSPDGGALLRQLGAPALPVSVVGKSSLTVAASGPAGQPLDTTVHATFGTTQATIAGRFTLFDTVRHGSGTLDVRSSDLSPLLQSVALAAPDRSTAIPAAFTTALSLGDDGATFSGLKGRLGTVAVSGSVRFNPANDDRPSLTGTLDLDHIAMSDLVALAFGPPQGSAAGMAWSSLRFGAVLFDPPRTGLALKIATLDLAPRLVATDAAVDLGLAPNLVTLTHGRGSLAGGAISSDVTLRRDGSSGALEGRITIDKVAVDLPGLRTRASGTLDVAGSGVSALALVSSLAGTGSATFVDATIPGIEAAALPKVFVDVENDTVAVDQETIARSLQEKGAGSLDLGPRSFGLALAGGTLQLEEQDHTDRNSAAQSSAFPRRRALERRTAAADLRKAEADRKARLDAERLEKIRREEASRAAAQRAALEKAAHDKAAREKTARDKAAEDQAARDQADKDQADRARANDPQRSGPAQDGGAPAPPAGNDPAAAGHE